MASTQHSGWLRRVGITVAYVLLAVAWRLISNMVPNVGWAVKAVPVALTGLVFLGTVVRSARLSGQSLLRAMVEPVSCVLAASTVQGVLSGFSADWGLRCNQCDPWISLVEWPVLAFAGAVPVAAVVAAITRALTRDHDVEPSNIAL